jgi:hypothetical protein
VLQKEASSLLIQPNRKTDERTTNTRDVHANTAAGQIFNSNADADARVQKSAVHERVRVMMVWK